MEALKKLRIFNSNTIKLIAAVFMFIDHLALIFFPFTMWLRKLGRLAMPLFSFAIAEGCRYTKNKWKHFFLLFGLGAVCQLAYFIFNPTYLYLGILINFSFSTLIIYALQFAKKCTFAEKPNTLRITCAWLLFAALMVCVYAFFSLIEVDHGFWGCMMPVFASLFDFHRIPAPAFLKKLDVLPMRILCMAIPMIPLALSKLILMPTNIRLYGFLALPILLLYNGEKGKAKMKYFFYIFYPLHIGLLSGIAIAISLL